MDHVEPQSQPQPNFMEIARSIIALNQQNQLNQFYRNSLLQAGLLGQTQSSASTPSLDLSSVHESNLLNSADNGLVTGGNVTPSAGHSAGHSSPGEEDDSTSDVKMEEDEIKNENNDEIESISTTSKSESIKDEGQSISAAASIFKLHGKITDLVPLLIKPNLNPFSPIFQDSSYQNSLPMDHLIFRVVPLVLWTYGKITIWIVCSNVNCVIKLLLKERVLNR